MSNAIQYDSLLVRDLAAELHQVLAGTRLDDVFLERDRLRVTLRCRAPRRAASAPPSLLWQLHPRSGHLTQTGADAAVGGRVQLGSPCSIRRVTAPPDERIVRFELDAPAGAAGEARWIIIELITNQWNALAVGTDGRIVAVLRERQTKDRTLRAGVQYEPPPPTQRTGATAPIPADEWLAALAVFAPGERLKPLLRFAAYTSPRNAAAVLGDADVVAGGTALLRALDRHTHLVWDAPRTPVIARLEGRWQPYPVSTGVQEEPSASLLAAFERAAVLDAAAPAAENAVETALAIIAERIDTVQKRRERLRDEHAGAAEEAARLRHHADVLLTQLSSVPRGADSVALEDWDGGSVIVELDPARSATENATRLYDTARRRDRAAARIPALVDAAGRELERLDGLAAGVRDGSVPPADVRRGRVARTAGGRAQPTALPYREYRTTGGVEVRVGRGSRANDDLTFRHSSPSDVWLHARDVAGAHVILRWPHPEANPPAADIAEAAVLAALYSRARTSGLVAVDWTRRKYVRKPRKAAPGLVVPERVRTVFVEPDTRLEERLRVEPA
ncbi:MAG: NFACT RNA binding domain-containing protein [Gemmatimonadota bacterium]